VAEILKLHHRVVAQRFADASILFADIVDFTKMSADMSPEQVVELLNDVFSAFDGLAERHRLEKIKTIGDAYMVVGGVPTPREAHLESLADMALDMLEETARYTPGNGRSLGLRIGIHAGPVVAGVVGTKKFLYDLWGDTVNIASRMESLGLPGAIHITEDVARRLAGPYRVEQRGSVRVKGKGEMVTYFLLGRTAGAQET
jgi:class 3 adenylate cyclase